MKQPPSDDPSGRPTDSAPHARSLLPRDPKSVALLQQRAAVLAQARTDSRRNEREGEQFLLFRLGANERFGISYDNLDDIMYLSHIAPVPGTPGFIAGVVNRRGQLLSVLDLQAFFQVAPATLDEQVRLVVVSAEDKRVGLLVHEVIGNELFDPDQMSPPIHSDGVSSPDYVRGIYQGRVTMLDIHALLGDPELTVNDSAAPHQ